MRTREFFFCSSFSVLVSRIQFWRPSSSRSRFTSAPSRRTCGSTTSPANSGNTRTSASTASALKSQSSRAQSALAKVTFSTRKRGWSQLHTARILPSMTSSRPVALVTARLIGPRRVFSPNEMKSASATRSASTTPTVHLSAVRISAQMQNACPSFSYRGAGDSVSTRRDAVLHFGEPLLAPLERGLLGQHAARGVVHVPLADAAGAELGEKLVEALAAEIEGLGVGAVAQAEHAIEHVGEVRAPRLKVLVEGAGVVGDVALAVGGGADEEHPCSGALLLEYRAVELVHHQRRDLRFAVVEGELHLLGAKLRRAGHGADQDVDSH